MLLVSKKRVKLNSLRTIKENMEKHRQNITIYKN